MATDIQFDLSDPVGRYRFLHHAARRYERQLGGDHRDVATEAWLFCEDRLHDVKANLGAWLRRVLFTKFIDRLRQDRLVATSPEVLERQVDAKQHNVIPDFQLLQVVEGEIARLPEMRREAVLLRLEHGSRVPGWTARQQNALLHARKDLLQHPGIAFHAQEAGLCRT